MGYSNLRHLYPMEWDMLTCKKEEAIHIPWNGSFYVEAVYIPWDGIVKFYAEAIHIPWDGIF